MAERIHYTPKPAKIGPDAHEELERLLQTLHEHGVLRFANDIVASNNEVAKVLVSGLSKPGSLNAIQNLAALGMMLSTIPPDQFYKVVFAVKDGLRHVAEYQPEKHDHEAPGVSGAYKLLHDEQLWQAVTPVIEGLKKFAEGLDRDIDKPISDYTGKKTQD
ncbi:DUF1641 domain-containing protein [Halomonas shantousis]